MQVEKSIHEGIKQMFKATLICGKR